MVGDERVEPLGVVARHVGHHVDQALVLDVAAAVLQLLEEVVLLGDRLELDHRHVAARGEGVVLVEHIGDAARHAGREVAPGLAEDDDDAAGHVFAAVVARALDHGDGARVADGEALAGDAAEVALAGDRAVEHGVADDDRLLRHDAGVLRRADDDAAARQALADIVVALADQLERDAGREPGAEALAAGAAKRDRRWCPRAGRAWPWRLATSPDSIAPAVRSVFLIVPSIRTGVRCSSAGIAFSMKPRSRMSWIGWFCFSLFQMATPSGGLRLVEQAREVEALGLPVGDGLGLVEHLHLPDHLARSCDSRARP